MITTHRLTTVHTRTLAAWSCTTAVSVERVVNERQPGEDAYPGRLCDIPGQFCVGDDTHVFTVGRAHDGCIDQNDRGSANLGDRRAGR